VNKHYHFDFLQRKVRVFSISLETHDTRIGCHYHETYCLLLIIFMLLHSIH